MISEPGIFHDVSESVYHGDSGLAPHLGRSLSVSGAKTLLKSPALFDYQRDHGRPPKDVFDFGHVAHKYVLGIGDQVVRVEAEDWRSKDARAAKVEARIRGQIPILAADDDRAKAMAAAVRAHPVAGKLFTEGEPEQSAYWVDERTGVTRRARFDWLRHDGITDLKTAVEASPAAVSKAIANYGYDMQDAWYGDALEALTGERVPFRFVFVEKSPPYLIAVYELDEESRTVGRIRNDEALALYAQCSADDSWPGYPEVIQSISTPTWHTRPYQGVLL